MPTSSLQHPQFYPAINKTVHKNGEDVNVRGSTYAPAARANGTSIPVLIACDTLHLARPAILHDSTVMPSLSAGENGAWNQGSELVDSPRL